jgi:predicted nucleotidyltransferase
MLQQISSGSVKIISLNRDKLLPTLRTVARQIKSEHSAVRDVRLFGSIARGDHVGTSDVDILIVLADLPDQELPTGAKRALPFYRYFALPIGVDLLVYTDAEIKKGNVFVTSIYTESLSLLS